MSKFALVRGPLAVCALFSGAVLFADSTVTPIVINEVAHDRGPNLRDVKVGPLAPGPNVDKPLRLIRPNQVTPNKPDPVVQFGSGPLVSTTGALSFAGVGNGDYGFTPNAAPPDTNGAVGATQYVQWVNESFAVFNKSTGALVYGPVAGNTLWSGFGGGCQNNNDGDPIVQYDKIANRWIMTQFSVSTTPYLQCVAVSTTSDAAGSYNRYAFTMPNFNDYPKLGVWPDGYYMSFNMFNGNSFVGGMACALDRNKMLTGAGATAICFQLGSNYGGLLPSDLDGSTAPPSGSPNYFLAFGTNSLQLWKFHPDFATPANSTFAGPTTIPVAAFSEACGGGTCIPQPGTRQQLDSLGDRLMYRLAYRNFGDHEALVANHSVSNNGVAAVRWYELRNPNTASAVYQQGTFSPDSTHRWMGSIGMDKLGNIAVGYSMSSSTVFPSIAYTGRAPGDALGTMQAEKILLQGSGSQTFNLSRWGDYSAMTIDPVDDCTFWYTNEYLKASGAFNWSTWISSFRFPGCTGPPPVLTTITVSPASASVQTGGTKQFAATGLDQFGNPMSPQPTFTWLVSGGGTINNAGLFTAGSSTGGPFTVTATGGGLSGTASVTVTNGPADFTISATNVTVTRGGSSPSTITIGAVNGFSGTVNLSVSGLPPRTSGSFNPLSVTGSGTSTLTISANRKASTGAYNLTVTGTSGGLQHSVLVTLTVQ